MAETDRSRRGATFDRIAALYDEVRPGYPDEMVEAVIAHVGVAEETNILEVGCGPGKATLPFASRGHRILAIEPGAALAAIARQRCAGYPKVRIEETRFEDWPLRAGAFDLLISGQAWHWIDPVIGDAKAAAALRPGGSIALFWNRPVETHSELRSALDEVYTREAPQLLKLIEPGGRAATSEPIDERIAAAGGFGPVDLSTFPWQQRYETERYLKLMETQSDHQLLAPEQRARLFDGIRHTLDESGGEIQVCYDAVLIQARRV